MSEDWLDIDDTPAVAGYGIHRMATINETGSGRICYLQLFDARDGNEHAFLVDWGLAQRLAWEMTGVLSGYAEQSFHFDMEQVDVPLAEGETAEEIVDYLMNFDDEDDE